MHAYRDQYAQMFRGGRDVVLLAISTDTAEELAAWARDDEFPFLMGSDDGARVGRLYGAFLERPAGAVDNRTLFVVDPAGRITYVAAPFLEMDPTAYDAVAAEIERVVAAHASEGETP